MNPNRNYKNSDTYIIIIILVLSISYAVLRYNILGPVPWKDLPLFIMNKGISLAAFILLMLNFSLGPLQNLGTKVPECWLNSRVAIGMTGFFLAFLHVIISLILFKPVIYAKFFIPDGSLTANAGISMLGGILSFIILWGYNLTFKTFIKEEKAFLKFITSRKFLLLSMLFGALHLFFMGYEGWLTPADWYGGLPPVSLLAFFVFCIGYLINILGRK